ncbi:MAG: NAD(P)-binding protein [Kofleriaceae bacterium]
MATRTLETDYLVVGGGAAGLAFTDTLIGHGKSDVIIVDRRHAPGGHWHDAYPFVRLHQPSMFYGVSSMPLGNDAIDESGLNEGFYEQASAAEICAYYDRVMQRQLLPSGRVRYFPMSDYAGEHRFVFRLTGEVYEVKVNNALVDATYLQPAIPSSYPPPFEVAAGARVVPVNELVRADQADRYVIIGAGKTAIDACLWLLQAGVSTENISWIKPREAWLTNRAYAQPGELVASVLDGVSLQLEAAALASSVDDLFARLEASEQLLRVDSRVTPTMFKGPTMSAGELAVLRRLDNVVRLGRVRRVDQTQITLDGGSIATTARTLHVHCAAPGLNPAPAIPMFGDHRITLQPIRVGLIPFNAAIVGFIEATRHDVTDKNRLCPPNRLPNVPLDWIRGMLIATNADHLWSREPDIAAWLESTRLNPSRGLRRFRDQPRFQQAQQRFAANVRPGLAKLARFVASAAA